MISKIDQFNNFFRKIVKKPTRNELINVKPENKIPTIDNNKCKTTDTKMEWIVPHGTMKS